MISSPRLHPAPSKNTHVRALKALRTPAAASNQTDWSDWSHPTRRPAWLSRPAAQSFLRCHLEPRVREGAAEGCAGEQNRDFHTT